MNKIQFKNVLPQIFKTSSGAIWLQDVTFERGRHYLVEAESGKGKSTFCSYILGYRHDYSGQLLFDDRDARSYSISDWSQLRQRHVSCLFQELRLFPELSAFENVEIKNKLTRNKTRQQIEQWFERLGIADKLTAKVGRMSFGQQQRVALIRALVQPFDFLLADEPISHLDDRNAETMAALLKEEAERQGAAIIVTSIGKRLPMDYDFMMQL
jgi:ABC-type lipoprotein export system ATPase subunit